MKITIDEQQEIISSPLQEEFNKIWLECTTEIYQAERLIYYVDIDGQVLYNQYEQFIQDHLQIIENIKIHTMSRFDSINETEEQLVQYLNKFIPGMTAIVDQMYGDMSNELWGELATGLEGLQWIASSFEFLKILYSSDILNNIIIGNYCSDLESIVKDLDTNLTEDDLVAVADLFKYELLPLLDKYNAEIGKSKVQLS
ncbi:hypothetical protein MHH52_26785 [Paenibacillus sp. FSL K6-0276]|uniref:hypothetical protein n=1 Tax=Paenibacillus sp. FSL K6-0276 TaxID=2921450 RepID=UPI0030EEC751